MTPLIEIKWNDPRLIEALARRLRLIGHHCGTCASSDDPPSEYWNHVATECARQMAWIRHEDQTDVTYALKDSDQELYLLRPVEPAPASWSPE